MPTWGEILAELHASASQTGAPDFDGIRRRYLAELAALTGRSTIIYYTDWLGGSARDTSMVLEDVQGFMEAVRGTQGEALDLVLHVPGGSAEAAARIVEYLRAKFKDIRVFVPLAAMSAGTMLALAADEIVMGAHSQLGPIDPQMFQPQVGRFVPSRAIVDQFKMAQAEVQMNPAALAAWVPSLQQYGTSLLAECVQAEELARTLVEGWLTAYMLASNHPQAQSAASWFADATIHKSHSLGINRDSARAQGIKVVDLEVDQHLQDAVLSVHHATMHTLSGPANKIIESHLGRAWVKMAAPAPGMHFIPGPPLAISGPFAP